MSLYLTDDRSTTPPVFILSVFGTMYIPSSRRRCCPAHVDTMKPSTKDEEGYTYTAVNPQDQAQIDRYVEVYRAWGERQPVSTSDLERLRIRLAQMQARCARLTIWGIDTITLASGALVAMDMSHRALALIYNSMDPDDPWSAGRALGRIYGCKLLSNMPWSSQRRVRRNVVYAVVLETAYMYMGEGEQRAIAIALLPGTSLQLVEVERPTKRRRIG